MKTARAGSASPRWAGKGWGAIYLPRVGQEVIVDFLEGDPDRPIITGRVYNAANMPPFALPGGKTRRENTTKTYKVGFNEMSMDDTPGAEQIRVHGQHNMDTVVENDQTLKVGVQPNAEIGNNESTTIGSNRTENVGSNEAVTIGSNQQVNVGDNQAITVGNNIVIKAGNDYAAMRGCMHPHEPGRRHHDHGNPDYRRAVRSMINIVLGLLRRPRVCLSPAAAVASITDCWAARTSNSAGP